jgi:transcriptional regulatory protein LevR
MTDAKEKQHKKMVETLTKLVSVIEKMCENNKRFLLKQNLDEAKDWLAFLEDHNDLEEVESLEKEFVDRLVFKFDVEIERSALDNQRATLMKDLLRQFEQYLRH